MIKDVYTITERNALRFTEQVNKITQDLQSDGLKVDIKFSTNSHQSLHVDYTMYSAMIIGIEK